MFLRLLSTALVLKFAFFSVRFASKITKVCTNVTWGFNKSVIASFRKVADSIPSQTLGRACTCTNEVGLVDWSKLPDVAAVALLTVAFASVARQGRNSVSGVWLIGWLMIVLHFFAYMFLSAPGHWSDLASFVGTAALVCAGVLFMWASVPYRKRTSSRWMLAVLLRNQYALSWPY